MNDPDPATESLPSSPRDHVNTLASAAFEVATSALAERGIDKVRILNESKFLHLLRELAEPEDERGDGVNAGSALLSPPGRGGLAQKWRLLRARHEASLREIEKRMLKLSFSFERLSDKLGRIEAVASLPPGE